MSSFQKGLIFGSLVVCLTVLCSVSVPAQSSDLKGQKGQDGKTSQTLEKKSESKKKGEAGEKSTPKPSGSKKSASKPEKNKKPKEVLDPDKTDRFYTFKDEKGIEWIKQPYRYVCEEYPDSMIGPDRRYDGMRYVMDINDDGIGEVFVSCGPEGGTGGMAWRCFVKGQKGYVKVFGFQGSVVAFAGKKNGFQVLKTFSRSGGTEAEVNGSLITWEWNGSRYIKAHSEEAYPYHVGRTKDGEGIEGEYRWILTKDEQAPFRDKKLPNIYESSSNAWEDKPVWKPEPEQE